MDDRDLDLLREFRAHDALPPTGLQERIQEELWEVVLAEEARTRTSRAAGPWGQRGRLLQVLWRPAMAAAVMAAVAVSVAVMSNGAATPGAGVASGARDAATTPTNILDATANALFGTNAATATAVAPTAGTLPSQDSRDDLPLIAAGPSNTSEATLALAAQLPRRPDALRGSLQDAAAEITDDGDTSDRVAFRVAMRWIVNPTVPSEVRANMLRSLNGLHGIDGALRGTDVLGRSGIVLGHVDEHTAVREQYVLTADGGTLLERRAFVAGYADPACPPGTFTDHALYENGNQLDATQLPWVDWPELVAACDPESTGVR